MAKVHKLKFIFDGYDSLDVVPVLICGADPLAEDTSKDDEYVTCEWCLKGKKSPHTPQDWDEDLDPYDFTD